MSKFIYQVKNMKVLLGSAATLVIAVIFIMNYFTPAEAFREHVRSQELKELLSTTTQYELSYKCYRETCSGNMPPLLYKKYVEMLARMDALKKEKKGN